MKVSVLMPVYNNEKTVARAIESILNQTYKDFELLIYNDGSTDKTDEVCSRYLTDKRVDLCASVRNRGISVRLNDLLFVTIGEYIARQDGDDESLPTRLEKQVRYLDKHRDVSVLGTQCYKKGEQWILPRVIDDSMYKENNLVHGSVMIKREVFDRFKYDKKLRFCQDWDLWCRMHKAGIKMHNLKEKLYRLTWKGEPTGKYLQYVAIVGEKIRRMNDRGS